MTKKEKVLTGLECCMNSMMFDPCPHHCPYYADCLNLLSYAPLLADCMELLKEQEPVKPIRLENWWKCTSCGGNIVANMKYCPRCGRSVKWND